MLIMNIGNGMHLIPAAELVGIPEWLSIKPYGNQWQAVGHYHPLPIPKWCGTLVVVVDENSDKIRGLVIKVAWGANV